MLRCDRARIVSAGDPAAERSTTHSLVSTVKEMPKDPWGSDYIYRDPGLKNPGGYDLYFAGPDRQADTSDDDWGNN